MNLDIDHVAERTNTGTEFVGLRRLLAAMFTRALLDAAAYSLRVKRGFNFTLADAQSGWAYVMQTGRAWPLSFESLCALFNLDPARVRKIVKDNPLQILQARAYGTSSGLPGIKGGDDDA